MKKIFLIMMIGLFFLIFVPVGIESEGATGNRKILTVGERYEISDYMYGGSVQGSSVRFKKGVVTAKKPGKSMVVYTNNDGSLKSVKITVKKSGIKVSMLDVGQGDAFLIQVNGKVVLLDSGEKNTYTFLKQQLDHFEIQKIDMLIISHMDTDHMGAAQMIMQEYSIRKVMLPETPGNSTEYGKLMNYIEREKITLKYVHAGERHKLGKGCSIYILGADTEPDTNGSSIVMRLKYYNNTFLFTGDAPASVLNKIMENGADISADVIKIPHHGSDSSSPILFLKETGAKYALISTGKDNAYGHPAANVVRRLSLLGMETLRTDIEGTVTITGNSKEITYNSEYLVDWDAENKLTVETGNVIGNKNSKVYHKSTCISLPAEKNRVYFLTEEDAEAAGYRECGMCHRK